MAQNAINNTILNANFTVQNGNISTNTGSITSGSTVTATTGLTVIAGGATISGNTTINGGTVGIGTDNAGNAITIGTGTVARNINIGLSAAAHVVNIGTNSGASSLGLNAGTGDMRLISGDEITLDASGVLELNSTGGAISIGNDANAQAINIGTGAAARTITIGNNTTTTALQLTSGTGSITLTSTGTGDIILDSDDTMLLDADGVLELNSSAGAISIGNDADAQAINIGTGAAARTITVGNTTGATDLDLRCGTGDFTLASATGTIINALDTGEITYPLQPAFLAYQSADVANVTGAGTVYTIGTTTALTEVFDQNGDFNTNGTFTAPVTGRYYFGIFVTATTIAAGMTNGRVVLVTSNAPYRISCGNYLAIIDTGGGSWAATGSLLLDMDATDTATVTLQISGGAGNTAVLGGDSGGQRRTALSGSLLV